MIASQDNFGNKIIVTPEGDKIKIQLSLLGEKRLRSLGYVEPNKRVMFIKRNRGKHLHIKSRSYGFNHHLLSNAKKFDTIDLSDEHTNWLIPVEFILKNGKFLHFKQDGFERQIFIGLENITQFVQKKDALY